MRLQSWVLNLCNHPKSSHMPITKHHCCYRLTRVWGVTQPGFLGFAKNLCHVVELSLWPAKWQAAWCCSHLSLYLLDVSGSKSGFSTISRLSDNNKPGFEWLLVQAKTLKGTKTVPKAPKVIPPKTRSMRCCSSAYGTASNVKSLMGFPTINSREK